MINKPILFITAACIANAVVSIAQAEPRLLPPIIDHSDYSGSQKEHTESQLGNRRSVMEVLQQVSRLQSEVQQLRGQVEEQKYELKQLKKRQQSIYMDMNNRLSPSTAMTMPANKPVTPIRGNAAKEMKTAANIQQSSTFNKFNGGNSNIIEKMAFDKAFEQVRNKEYQQAVTQFKQFLISYPESKYSDNALFWLASVYKVLKDIPAAKDTYNKVVKQYPDSDKAALSLLKLGDLYAQEKQLKQAKVVYVEIMQKYANTTEAHQAEKKLQEMDF